MTSLDATLDPITGALTTQFEWITDFYNRLIVEAVTQSGEPGEKPRRLPLVNNNGEYTRIYPDESMDGLLFWITTGPATFADWPDAYSSGLVSIRQPVALIIWGKPDEESSLGLSHDMLKVLVDFPQFQGASITDQLQIDVFRGLDYDFINHRYLMHPFQGIRIDGTVTYQETQC